ncbi:male accessory gland serine protease inhibitor-like [Drosophila miranda]|uniref:male accessory gland serine protease inhibitor-like n=1 Tax=Drosophila miranda TaxID=7229 RepID=UPI00143FA5B8|nr:male accessory gland serine protease inhibitor-like [Drosophila miranda]
MTLISVVVIIIAALSGLSRALKDPICALEPASQGTDGFTCHGHFPRYSYYLFKNECERWIYGGCGRPNKNNFGTIEECEHKCKEAASIEIIK